MSSAVLLLEGAPVGLHGDCVCTLVQRACVVSGTACICTYIHIKSGSALALSHNVHMRSIH
jgi:hypothetical protein